ncbi:MAG: 2-oxoacid:ferredoxin oxidoreductase subunit beta [Deltaproteobacteria bacterium]|nr:2-oxoacid:ferredoxin oxidoreductase subunit beta [Deltaproteobacteria bacterium]MBI3296501.1 2-oxoacid:ferredoxin oxidoreductase subunit beta [Deltaproteobacteria bacterium]
MDAAKNRAGLTKNDYMGKPSTLCKGCGHDSITAAIIESYFQMGVKPHMVAKVSGIGCSSKTPTYFIDKGHGFNSVHGRMPAVATGAKIANHDLIMLGVSGDGDTASIGMGQFCHVMRRNVDMTYIIENNGTYGLTKGQFSATADQGAKAKKGTDNPYPVIDTCAMAIELGATFVGRSFSGDRKQVISLLKAALSHKGMALLDIISPCVTFNNHEGSTKSYTYCKTHDMPLHELGYVPAFDPIEVEIKEGEIRDIALHDGSHLTLKKLGSDYDPTNKMKAIMNLHEARQSKTLATGLLYFEKDQKDLAGILNVCDTPLSKLQQRDLVPSRETLAKVMAGYK